MLGDFHADSAAIRECMAPNVACKSGSCNAGVGSRHGEQRLQDGHIPNWHVGQLLGAVEQSVNRDHMVSPVDVALLVGDRHRGYPVVPSQHMILGGDCINILYHCNII